jgi:hypothetical protein
MHIPITSTATKRGNRERLMGAAFGAALLLTAVGVAARGTFWNHDDGGPTAAIPRDAGPATITGFAPGQDLAPRVVYLVRSADQAATVQGELRETNRLRFQNGERDLNGTVIVAGSAEENWTPSGIAALNQVRRVNGLPEIQVLDLRL